VWSLEGFCLPFANLFSQSLEELHTVEINQSLHPSGGIVKGL